MDWNKTNTILITAFIILNVFLLASSSYMDKTEYNPDKDKEFAQNVESLLNQKNIVLNTDIPDDDFIMPVLYTEYEIIQISPDLLDQYLGEKIQPLEGVFTYSNKEGDTLEIIDGKKLRLTLADKGDKTSPENIEEKINDFIQEKKIDAGAYVENLKHISQDDYLYIYTQKYNDFSVDNSYMKFFANEDGIYKFEMQRIISITEIPERVRTIHAVEALLRILTYPEINNKEISKIEMTYYSVEDDNWQNIERINSDPTWKVIFSDGTQKHLPGID